MRGAVGEVGDTHGSERLAHPGLERLPPQTEVRRAEGDVIPDRRHEELVVGVLEHDAHAAAHLQEVAVGDRQARDGHRPPARGEDAVEVQHECRLAGAVGPQQRDTLAPVHVQVHPEEGLVSPRVGVGDPLEVQHGDAHDSLTVAETTAATSAGRSASAHCDDVADSGEVTGIDPDHPRLTMARCTRSPRS